MTRICPECEDQRLCIQEPNTGEPAIYYCINCGAEYYGDPRPSDSSVVAPALEEEQPR